ncbi:MAG: hypothetical protein PVI75_05045 [Gammaproteobacteria bacterium]|jgi:hypothetical protein
MCFCKCFCIFFRKPKINNNPDVSIELQKKYQVNSAAELIEKLMQLKKCSTYEELLQKFYDRLKTNLHSEQTLEQIHSLIEIIKLKIESQKNKLKHL